MTIKEADNSPTVCPKFEHTFTILGKKWNGIIIDVLLDEPLRFKDISKRVPGISDRVLVERLKSLEQEDLLKRVQVDQTSGYSLTEKGYELKSVMSEVQRWANEWICNDDLNRNK